MNKTTTTVVESVDSCRSCSVAEGQSELVSAFEGCDALSSPYVAGDLSWFFCAEVGRPLDDIRAFDVVLIDTCELMSPVLELFLDANGALMRTAQIKLSIIPSVLMELFRHCSNANNSTRESALRGWKLVVSDKYGDLFSLYRSSHMDQSALTTTFADGSIVDVVRSLKLRDQKNVLLITRDKELSSSIFNSCCTRSLSRVGGNVQVLYMDGQSAQLTRYHSSRLMSLSRDVILPDWPSIGAVSTTVLREKYFHDAICNGTVFMDSCALKYALKPSFKTNFMENLRRLQALRPGQKIKVVPASLYDPEVRHEIEAMPHIFEIVESYDSIISEEDALLHAIIDALRSSNDQHLLLITNHPRRYSPIAGKLPTCYKIKEFWGCYIDTTYGLLQRTLKNNAATCAKL